MATDIDAILAILERFYDFRDRSVVHVGAGGGQLIGYAVHARSVLGVDPDQAAIARLETAIREKGWEDRFTVVQKKFSSVSSRADVVFFEFCLHEMDDPAGALRHARSVAPDILVMDHSPDSAWAWYTCETEKAERSWAAVRRHPIVREASFDATQRFGDYGQLLAKLEVLGDQAIERIQEFRNKRDIRIGMKYSLCLIRL